MTSSAPCDLFDGVIPQAWLPDESLFSLCSRHHWLSNNFKSSSTCQQLFGHRSQGSAHDLPSRVGYFVEVTKGQLGDAQTIIRRRTVLPFYLPFSTRVVEAATIESMTGPSIGSLKFQLGLLTSRFRANHPLKACPTCMASDRPAWGGAYWHLEHQLPGVWICPAHGEVLWQSDLKASGVGRFQWHLPDASHLTQPVSHPADVSALRRGANLSIWLWSQPAGIRFDPVQVSETYRLALRERGLIRGRARGRLTHKEVGRQYSEFLVPLRQIDELRALPETPEAAAREVARLSYEPRGGLHPLRHLALIGWLFGDALSFVDAMSRSAQSLRQAEPAMDTRPGEPGNDHRQTVLLGLVSSGLSVSAASRQLGIDPHTGMAWLAREGISTNKRPSVLKDDVRSRMKSALMRGAAKSDVATLGGVSIESVTRLLRTEVGLRAAWTAARNAKVQTRARSTWSRLLAANPNSGVNAVRLARPDIYAWLYRNDREWMLAQAQQFSIQRDPGASRLDWDGRDRALADEVADVSLKLANEAPGRRVKLWQIYQRLPELKAKLGHLDQLPLTHLAIKSALRAKTDAVQFP